MSKFEGRLDLVAAENIKYGQSVVLLNGKIVAGKATRDHDDAEYIGEAADNLREGFRLYVKDDEVTEDDA